MRQLALLEGNSLNQSLWLAVVRLMNKMPREKTSSRSGTFEANMGTDEM